MHVTLCDFIEPWESTSATQKKSLTQRYSMGCDCKVKLKGHSCTVVKSRLTTIILEDASRVVSSIPDLGCVFFFHSSDNSLHLHPLHDQQPGGVPLDGLGDREDGQRTAGQILCLYQEE